MKAVKSIKIVNLEVDENGDELVTIDRKDFLRLEAENERLTKKYSKSLEMMAGRAEIINQLQAELAECRQAAFENGRETERAAGYGRLEY